MKNQGHFKKSIVYGVGVDDTDYPKERRVYQGTKSRVIWICAAYSHWKNMLKRVYHDNIPAYKGVEVSKEWHMFSNFKAWFDENYIEGYVLDKDLYGGKLYSADTCVFIPERLNLLIMGVHKETSGTWYDKTRGNYQAYVTANGKRSCLGRFSRFEDAKIAHLRRKVRDIKEYAEVHGVEDVVECLVKQIDNRIKLLEERGCI